MHHRDGVESQAASGALESAAPEAARASHDRASAGAAASAAVRPRHDLLAGNIRPVVFWLALPVFGEQVLSAMVAWNDTFLAGHIDAQATAAVGFGAYVGWLVSMLFSLIGIGATAIVARHFGERRFAEANAACNQAVLLSLGLGLIATALTMYAAPPIVGLLGLSPETAPVAVRFIRVEALSYVPESLTFIGAACLRGAGDTRTPLKLIGTVNIVNALASWVLTFGVGPFGGFGTAGIAAGTATARLVGGVLTAMILLRGRGHLVLSRPELRLRFDLSARILRIGLPAALDGGFMWLGHFAFMSILTRAPYQYSGDVLYAAHIVGIRIESLSYLPAWAWSIAASTLVGQNLGASNARRALECAREARRQAVLLLLGSGCIFYFGAAACFRFLSNDPRVVECGVPALQALAFVQPFVATLIVYLGALRGAGDTLVPMTFTVLGMFLLRVPIAYWGGMVLRMGVLGVWFGMFADLILRAILMTWRLRSGRWKTIRV
ncbi:MAG: MATE family efflux transporter [Phycisphaerae bacterium]|nr:MATE family efflux transporter [Phycisphaerae bacterium]